jgi:hypothetical protein
MNVPMLASRVALRYASLHGTASLRRAGLFDRDLVAKAVKSVMDGMTDDGEVYSFEYDDRTNHTFKEDEHEFEWEDDYEGGGSGTIDIPVREPVKSVFYIDFALPAKLVVQVPTAQREVFMLEVLNLVAYKLKPNGFVASLLGGKRTIREILEEENGRGSDFNIDGDGVERARASAPEQAGRLVIRGADARLPVKVNATYAVDWSWGAYFNASSYIPDFEGDEPDYDFDDSAYGPYGYSPD